MGLPRDIAALGDEASLLGLDAFTPTGFEAVAGLPNAAAILERLGAAGYVTPDTLRLCLQAVAICKHEGAADVTRCELVATLPPGVPGIARPTRVVTREMIEAATTEVILLGYEVNEGGLLAHLVSSRRRGLDVIVIGDRARKVTAQIRQTWPSDVELPRLYEDRDHTHLAPFASMHAKCLLIDSQDLLITSANFTFHGLGGNIELGVRLAGRAGEEARKIFGHLVDSGAVVRVA